MEEKYSSTALYSVNNNSSESMLAGAARQYGDVASMIGLNLPSSSQDKSSYAFELLLSKDIIRSLLDDENESVSKSHPSGWYVYSRSF